MPFGFTLARVAHVRRYDHATWADFYPGLAVEERDLRGEANNEEGCASAWFEAICQMYPNKSIAN